MQPMRFLKILYTCVIVAMAYPIWAAGVGASTGYPIPRFVSTKTDTSNIRMGPGTRYPIRFVYRVSVPLQVIDEYEDWRHIKDWDGTQGWIHKTLLSGKKRAITLIPMGKMYDSPTINAPIIAKMEKNVVVHVRHCANGWCNVSAQDDTVVGYVPANVLWGGTD